jgi:hypothetical protein
VRPGTDARRSVLETARGDVASTSTTNVVSNQVDKEAECSTSKVQDTGRMELNTDALIEEGLGLGLGPATGDVHPGTDALIEHGTGQRGGRSGRGGRGGSTIGERRRAAEDSGADVCDADAAADHKLAEQSVATEHVRALTCCQCGFMKPVAEDEESDWCDEDFTIDDAVKLGLF